MADNKVTTFRYPINNSRSDQARQRHERTFRECADSYVAHGGDAKYLPRIVEYFGDTPVLEIFPFDIEQMVKVLYPWQANATKNRHAITPVRAVFIHGYKRGWCDYPRIPQLRTDPPKKKKPATAVWLNAFVKQCRKDGLPHVAAIVLFMSQTAARVSEAINLRWAQVDFKNRLALLLRTKTGTNSTRGLTDQVIECLRGLAMGSSDDDRVFRYTSRYSVNERIKEVCRRAKIPYKSSHACGRCTFATMLYQAGVDIKTIMAAGDWRTLNMFWNTYVFPRVNAARIAADSFNALQIFDDDDEMLIAA